MQLMMLKGFDKKKVQIKVRNQKFLNIKKKRRLYSIQNNYYIKFKFVHFNDKISMYICVYIYLSFTVKVFIVGNC